MTACQPLRYHVSMCRNRRAALEGRGGVSQPSFLRRPRDWQLLPSRTKSNVIRCWHPLSTDSLTRSLTPVALFFNIVVIFLRFVLWYSKVLWSRFEYVYDFWSNFNTPAMNSQYNTYHSNKASCHVVLPFWKDACWRVQYVQDSDTPANSGRLKRDCCFPSKVSAWGTLQTCRAALGARGWGRWGGCAPKPLSGRVPCHNTDTSTAAQRNYAAEEAFFSSSSSLFSGHSFSF